ncbi:hypothetical protein DY000_02048963 [Brassica cretica]|uniref:Uncharacterized protein n=1 Tax=Brassica cretica TaxID=69181 RepID=A0ABQ7EVG8_BRACR|nr:hypothetical protein DY000_02048963 [Brassica cretica]
MCPYFGVVSLVEPKNSLWACASSLGSGEVFIVKDVYGFGSLRRSFDWTQTREVGLSELAVGLLQFEGMMNPTRPHPVRACPTETRLNWRSRRDGKTQLPSLVDMVTF